MKKNFTTKRIIFGIIFLTLLGVALNSRPQVGSPSPKDTQVATPGGKASKCALNSKCPDTGAESKKYTHASLGFSFTYPQSFLLSSFGSVYDETGETLLLQTDGSKEGLQILVTTFDEDIALSAERIQRDVPDMKMSKVSTRTLGANEKIAEAVIFTSTNSFIGESSEAWFVHEKRLYQISAPIDAKELFDSIITSWEF